MKGEWVFVCFSSHHLNLKRLKSCAFGMLCNTNCKIFSKCAILYVYKAVVKAYHLDCLLSNNAMKTLGKHSENSWHHVVAEHRGGTVN